MATYGNYNDGGRGPIEPPAIAPAESVVAAAELEAWWWWFGLRQRALPGYFHGLGQLTGAWGFGHVVRVRVRVCVSVCA